MISPGFAGDLGRGHAVNRRVRLEASDPFDRKAAVERRADIVCGQVVDEPLVAVRQGDELVSLAEAPQADTGVFEGLQRLENSHDFLRLARVELHAVAPQGEQQRAAGCFDVAAVS